MYWKEWAVIGGVVLAVVLVFIVLIRGVEEMSVPGKLAEIEQLREDVVRVASGSNEDVIGQVTQWNQEIRSAKRYRMVWWGRLCTPEEWESVNVIEIP
ncbi:hypothetical protein [Thiocapsa sp. N5-Cardenillas]|uniref:hypothetical protein n=1 Tax=Thiocapsa sp. N5-Cardenillas TaxID=3137397 RepID=UPI0035B474C6